MTPGGSDAALLRRAVTRGAIGGSVGVYLALVGIVQRFNEREIVTGVINLGPLLLLVVYVLFGFTAARPPKVRHGETPPPPPSAPARIGAGAVAGALAAAFVSALLLIASAIELRSVFVSVTDPLLDILSFGRGAASGAPLQLVVGGVLGALGAGLQMLPAHQRKPALVGVAGLLLLSLAEPLLRVVFINIGLEYEWLYESGGLTVVGAVLAFVGPAAAAVFWTRAGTGVRERVEALPPQQRKAVSVGGFLLLILVLVALPQVLGTFLSEVIGTVGIYVLLGLGLNIVVGYAGLLDLGYVAFFAIGAYAMAILTSPAAFTNGPLDFWVALPLVVVIATVCGVLIGAPVLRLRGDYLAIVTLGFGEIVRIVVLSNWMKPWTGGSQGILQIPDPAIGGFQFDDSQSLYYLIVACCVAAAFVSKRVQDSRVGRAWVAMREDEQVAEAMGISIIKTKLLAFAMGAAVGSFSGIFFATKIGSVFPHSFNILVSITVLAVVVLGGMGSIPGVIAGAVVLVALPELLREFVEYRMHIYGAILVAIMVLKPEGLIPSARRRLELHEEEREEIQYEHRHAEDVSDAAPVVAAAQEDAR